MSLTPPLLDFNKGTMIRASGFDCVSGITAVIICNN